MYDIDLFDVGAGQISSLRSDARIVLCYFSAGSHEDWRPDAAGFPESAIGNPLDGWALDDECDLLMPFIDAGKHAGEGLGPRRVENRLRMMKP